MDSSKQLYYKRLIQLHHITTKMNLRAQMSYAHIKRGHLCNRMVDVSITIHLDDAKIEQVEQDPETFF